MPRSRSPNGIQAACPLQRAWISCESSGSSRLKAATDRGACSSSKRAVSSSSATVIEGREHLEEIGRRILWEGAQPVRFVET